MALPAKTGDWLMRQGWFLVGAKFLYLSGGFGAAAAGASLVGLSVFSGKTAVFPQTRRCYPHHSTACLCALGLLCLAAPWLIWFSHQPGFGDQDRHFNTGASNGRFATSPASDPHVYQRRPPRPAGVAPQTAVAKPNFVHLFCAGCGNGRLSHPTIPLPVSAAVACHHAAASHFRRARLGRQTGHRHPAGRDAAHQLRPAAAATYLEPPLSPLVSCRLGRRDQPCFTYHQHHYLP